jgi:hypothetical protein
MKIIIIGGRMETGFGDFAGCREARRGFSAPDLPCLLSDLRPTKISVPKGRLFRHLNPMKESPSAGKGRRKQFAAWAPSVITLQNLRCGC